jgi:hypothetical protein
MITFFQQLAYRNETLYIFGMGNLASALLYILLANISKTKLLGINGWIKPLKFALSIGIFSLTMAWFTYELNLPATIHLYSWAVIVLLGFENIYIGIQAARGQLSHFNQSSPFYAFMFVLMGLAAALTTIYTGYVGVLFITTDFPHLPAYYVLAIRLGILLFVIFSFQGATMGARLSHTVGGEDGEPGLPLLNWSTQYGDLRIAHFIGMHALQVLPLLSFYVFKNLAITAITGLLYGLLAVYTLVRALKGKPLFATSAI